MKEKRIFLIQESGSTYTGHECPSLSSPKDKSQCIISCLPELSILQEKLELLKMHQAVDGIMASSSG